MSHRNARATLLVVAVMALFSAIRAYAATGEQLCLKGRYSAKAKYASCTQKAIAKFAGGSTDFSALQLAFAKCRIKFEAAWPKLQQRYPGTVCASPRYEDNGDGTVTDNLTLLQWEQKTDDASIHDKDDNYKWSNGPSGAADGPLWTTFFSTLNGGACFAGHCDWRLPTVEDLQSILLPEPYTCTTQPCIDPVFGATPGLSYMSASTAADDASDPTSTFFVWSVLFDIGHVYGTGKTSFTKVRAVRGGL